MELNALDCQKCGAALRVADDATTVTCGFCKSRLEVVRRGDSAHTKVIEDLRKENARLTRKLEAARLRDLLEEVDRAWEEDRVDFMIKGGKGDLHPPTVEGALVGGFVGVASGVVWFLVTRNFAGVGLAGWEGGPSSALPYLGLVPIVLGIGAAWFHLGRSRAYDRALALYEEERRAVEDRLRALGEAVPPRPE